MRLITLCLATVVIALPLAQTQDAADQAKAQKEAQKKAERKSLLIGGAMSAAIGGVVAGPVGLLVGGTIGVGTGVANIAWHKHSQKSVAKETQLQQEHDIGVKMAKAGLITADKVPKGPKKHFLSAKRKEVLGTDVIAAASGAAFSPLGLPGGLIGNALIGGALNEGITDVMSHFQNKNIDAMEDKVVAGMVAKKNNPNAVTTQAEFEAYQQKELAAFTGMMADKEAEFNKLDQSGNPNNRKEFELFKKDTMKAFKKHLKDEEKQFNEKGILVDSTGFQIQAPIGKVSERTELHTPGETPEQVQSVSPPKQVLSLAQIGDASPAEMNAFFQRQSEELSEFNEQLTGRRAFANTQQSDPENSRKFKSQERADVAAFEQREVMQQHNMMSRQELSQPLQQ
jgi:hypothetical protein